MAEPIIKPTTVANAAAHINPIIMLVLSTGFLGWFIRAFSVYNMVLDIVSDVILPSFRPSTSVVVTFKFSPKIT